VPTTRLVCGAVTSLLLAGAVSTAEAQRGLELGVRGGVSVASASFSEATFDKSNRTGFAGGVFLNYDLSALGFQVGAQYAQKGVDLDVSGTVSEFSLKYLEIPAVVKLGIPLGAVKPSVFGGVGLGFNTGCDNSGTDCGDNVKSTEFSGIAGADLALYVGSISLWVDGRYHFGLNNINEATGTVSDLKNQNWTFQAGIAFKLGS